MSVEDEVVPEELSEEAIVVVDAKTGKPAAAATAAAKESPPRPKRPSAVVNVRQEPSDYDDGEDEDEWEDSEFSSAAN